MPAVWSTKTEMKQMARNQPESSTQDGEKKGKKPPPSEHAVDDQIEDSFPASDPPSYAGGPHRAGAPKQQDKKPKRES